METWADYTPTLTPVEYHDGIWVKRDDLYCLGGVRGGKVRACYVLCKDTKLPGLVTASHRPSPQGHIVSAIAKYLGLQCRVHTPKGEFTDQMEQARDNGAVITQHDMGYNNVIIKRATDDAQRLGWLHVPFGMECKQAIESASGQVRNLPEEAKRLVIPVGSGISLAGVLQGMKRYGINLPVLGVMSGADSRERLNRYAPVNWKNTVTLVPSGVPYHTNVKAKVGTVDLDWTYEGKCAKFLEPGDILWCVGIKRHPEGENHANVHQPGDETPAKA